MKDMTSMATTMMTEEEKAEIEKQMNAGGPSTSTVQDGASGSTSAAGPSTAHAPPAPAARAAHAEPRPTDGVSAAIPAPAVVTPTTVPGTSSTASGGSHLVPHAGGATAAGASTSVASNTASEREAREAERREAAKRKAEQREKLREHEKARRKAMEARVAMLTQKMTERIRPFVEAKDPGGKDDPETLAFEAKMRREVEDLKLESFGVEVCDILCFIWVRSLISAFFFFVGAIG